MEFTKIDELKFDEKGLIPAVVVDAATKKVLTVAYMNRESLEISMKEGTTCFWSRSRQELWRKGETSGNKQHIVSITADCDKDALTVAVYKDGPACHLGTDSCFNNTVFESDEREEFSLEALMKVIEGRKIVQEAFQYAAEGIYCIVVSSEFCKTEPEFYCGEDYREHFKKLGFTVDW